MALSAALCLAGALFAAAPAAAQDGLSAAGRAGPGLLQSRADGVRTLRLDQGDVHLEMNLSSAGATVSRARLFGDYFLTGPGFGQGEVAGGLRLTSGVTVGLAHETANLPPLPRPSLVMAPLRAPGAYAAPLRDAEAGPRVALPYIGLGYSSASVREGWGLSADIGLGGMRPGERLRLGQASGTTAQAERVLNELRLAPVIQLGVSYAF
jgi:hypothetical protein